MFAFLIAGEDGYFMAARDPVGIKPLYYAENDGVMRFASEMHSFEPDWRPYVQVFPPGHFWTREDGFQRFAVAVPRQHAARRRAAEPDEEDYEETRDELIGSVHRQMMGDVPVGVFLSGGLDSTLIAAIAARWCDERGTRLKTFAVGTDGFVRPGRRPPGGRVPGHRAPRARFTGEEAEALMAEVVRSIEHFDPSLVRSAVANFLLAEMTAKHVKVVLTGEGADELFAGYEYLGDLDDPEELHDEIVRTIESLHNLNLQRADRVTMAHGLEARVPFLDREVIALALRQPARWKLAPPGTQEKMLLRRAFEGWLPDEPAVPRQGAVRRRQRHGRRAQPPDGGHGDRGGVRGRAQPRRPAVPQPRGAGLLPDLERVPGRACGPRSTCSGSRRRSAGLRPPARSPPAAARRHRPRWPPRRTRRGPRPPGRRSPGPAPSRACCAPPPRGRSARTRAADRSSSKPGPWSRTDSTPPVSPTSTWPPSGLHLIALPTRLVTARAIRSGSPRTTVGGRSDGLDHDTSGRGGASRVDDRGDDLVQAHVVLLAGRLGAARQLHHVADQAGQLVQLADDVGPHLLALGRAAGDRRRPASGCSRAGWRWACAARGWRRPPGGAGPRPSAPARRGWRCSCAPAAPVRRRRPPPSARSGPRPRAAARCAR